MTVCERNILCGGARGPPGTDGALGMFTGRGTGTELAGGFFVSFALDEEDDAGLPVVGFSRFPDTLALRPREAKNPPALEVGVVDPMDRIEEVGVPLARDDVRTGYR